MQEIALCCCGKADPPPPPPPEEVPDSCGVPNCVVCLDPPGYAASVFFDLASEHLNVATSQFGGQTDFGFVAAGARTYFIPDGPDVLEPCIWYPQDPANLPGILTANPEFCKSAPPPQWLICTPFDHPLNIQKIECVLLDEDGQEALGTPTAWRGTCGWFLIIPVGFGQNNSAGVFIEYLVARNEVCLPLNQSSNGIYRIVKTWLELPEPVYGPWTQFGQGSSVVDPIDATTYVVNSFGIGIS